FLQLYPAANILVATKKDFETKNRKRFCGRIATGEYDAVIIGHSQFEKIPMSMERQQAILQHQMDEILMGVDEAKRSHAENFTIKQMEKTRKGLEQKMEKLNDQSRKDDIVTFEELGVDRLFVDESHFYKNLFLYTKMRNVGGIAQTEAQKSSDLFMKCRYLDELTGGRGIAFATGTPISNSMVEMYTIQRYLQYNTLCDHGLQHFDSWAANFGETVTAIELSPEGTG
ncbi:MAG: helicase, partial [Clostridia bacterium]